MLALLIERRSSPQLTLALGPTLGTTAPWIDRAVPLPPMSPLKTTGLPWPATRLEAERTTIKALLNIFAKCLREWNTSNGNEGKDGKIRLGNCR